MNETQDTPASARLARRVRDTRRLLAAAAAVTVAGIALVVQDDTGIGRWLVVLGMLALVFGLHRFGRLGPDQDGALLAPEAEDEG
ncbi:MAG TPA: hypothetical protein VKY73_20710 [Polyangiaceae bacterium]|nr:hypothetical protein [Polyangiaceae bacterium]